MATASPPLSDKSCPRGSGYLTPGLEGSPTLRQFGQAVLLALASLALGLVLYVLEKYVFRCDHRFIDNPTETMVRALGIAHFLVGGLYLFTSPSMRSLGGLGRLLFWAAIGIGLCVGFAHLGGTKNAWMVLAFYSLFLVHEVRDQAELFLARGEGPAKVPGRAGVVHWLCVAVGLWLLVVLVGGFAMHALWRHRSTALQHVDPTIILGGLGFLLLAGVAAGWRFLRQMKHIYPGVSLLTFEPLLLVYLSLAMLLAAGSFLGSASFNFIILVHVTGWFVFVRSRLPGQAPRPGLWAWLRRARPGFVALHVGLALVLVMLLALRVHVWERSGTFCETLAGDAFPCWSIMHIILTFARRP